MPDQRKRSLPRLSKEAYQGFASVFWTHCIADRETGWLNNLFHFRFRELLCHLLSRYGAICPIYTLMPDHIHLLVTGVSKACNQLQLSRLLRREINNLILPVSLQSQAHDHLLRKEETEKNGFQAVSYYILQNPVRKEICKDWSDYDYTGCVVPGYFDLDPRQEDYWELFWRIHNKLVSNSN